VEQRAELEGFSLPPLKQGSKEEQLARLYSKAKGCKGCALSLSRTNLVFGEGCPGAEVVFVGEAPGREEDIQGRPFVGPAGKLLTKMIESIGMKRGEVYIANVLKCRPPENRDPLAQEKEKCVHWLRTQLAIVKPRVIFALGTFAAQALLETDSTISELRGRVFGLEQMKLVPSYHPAALLYHPEWKRRSWEDLKLLRKTLDEARQGPR